MKRPKFLGNTAEPLGACRWLILFGSLIVATHQAFAFPQILVHPSPQNVSSGTNVTFSLSVSNTAQSLLSVQWRRNGANIPGALFTTSNTLFDASYSITNVQPSDSGIYYALVYAGGVISSSNAPLNITNVNFAPVNDAFDSRGSLGGVLFNAAGDSARADNFGASFESGEPSNGKPGGSSVWLEWQAPFSGIAHFDTRGSFFDTTFGIYVIDPLGSGGVDGLIPVVDDDDAGKFFNSSVDFNAIEGHFYEISIDGLYGIEGPIVLNWSVDDTSDLIPEISTQPQSVTVAPGTNALLSVQIRGSSGGPVPQFQWFLNGLPIAGQSDSELSISNVVASTVGEYRVQVSFTNGTITRSVLSHGAEVQANSTGNPESAAQAKFREATDPNSGPKPNALPVSGFSGTHLYNTYGAAAEPGEPVHCNKVGGAPFWFSYAPPANGTLTVDANTTSFTNILAIYTGPGNSFTSLVSVACATTNTGLGHEVAVFGVTSGVTNWIVVDAINALTGPVTLTYSLASPPVISAQPQSQTVPQGNNVSLGVTASGTTPLSYQWRTNSATYPSRTNSSVTVTNFQAANEGSYTVVVTNTAGSVTSAVATLYLNSPLRFTNSASTSSNFSATLLCIANTNYIIQASTNLSTTNWASIVTNSSPYGILSIVDTNLSGFSNRFYRAVVKTN